jgi:hypothetical protein
MVAFNETVKKELFCNLNDEERADRSMKLSGLVSRLKETKARNESEKKKMKKEEDQIQAEISGLADVVEKRRELRTVPCRWEYDLKGPKDSIARLIRTDTEREVESHVMEPHEVDEVRQLSLDTAQPKVPGRVDNPEIPSKDELEALLKKHSGNTTAASAEIEVSRRQLNRWLDLRGVDADVFREKAKADA